MAFNLATNPPPVTPPPPPAGVARFNADGTPTAPQIEYEKRLYEYERALVAWLRLVATAIP